MLKNMIKTVTLGVLSIGLIACAEATSANPCGDGESVAVNGASYCVYKEAIVIVGGFDCPASMRFRMDFDNATVCGDHAFDNIDVPNDICARAFVPCMEELVAIDESDFPAAHADAYRRWTARCCVQSGRTPRELDPDVVPASQRAEGANVRYDGLAAARCVAALDAARCVSIKEPLVPFPVCDRVYVATEPGIRALGESCAVTDECAQNAESNVLCRSSFQAGEIVTICLATPTVEAGESCLGGDYVFPDCASQTFCDQTSGVCVPQARRGETCLTGAAWGDTCAAGSVCDRIDTHTCVAPTPVGQPCTSIEECEGLACYEGLCREPYFITSGVTSCGPG